MEFLKSKNGIHSLEVIISITIFAMFASGVFILFGSSLSESNNILKYNKADVILSESLSAVRSIRNSNWDSLPEGQHGLNFFSNSWAFSGSNDLIDNTFTRSVTISNISDNLKQIDASVSWNVLGRNILLNASTFLSNWKNLEVWGNWGNPVVVGSLDLGPQGQASDLALSGGVVFLTAEISSGSRPSFYSVDITDATNPTILDSISVGGSLNSLTLVGNYAYVVGEVSGSELEVFDVSDPSNLVLIKSISLSNDGLSIDSLGSEIFIGTENSVYIFDITDPVTPIALSIYPIGSEVGDVLASGNNLFLATSLVSQEVVVLSITDKTSPTYVSAFNAPGSASGRSLSKNGNVLYYGSDNASSTSPELFQLDITDLLNIVQKNSRDVGGGVQGIATAGQYVYLATGSSNNEFQIWQTGTNWEFIYTTGLNMAQMATGIAFDDNTIYISLRSNDAFQIIQPSP